MRDGMGKRPYGKKNPACRGRPSAGRGTFTPLDERQPQLGEQAHSGPQAHAGPQAQAALRVGAWQPQLGTGRAVRVLQAHAFGAQEQWVLGAVWFCMGSPDAARAECQSATLGAGQFPLHPG